MKTIQQALRFGKNFLKENNIISYDIDAKVLLMYTLNIDKITLLTTTEYISDESYEVFLRLLGRRAKNEPCAYIVNSQEFMGLPFYVDENVLIPRGDTEILVEEAIALIKKYNFETMLDMCTGQGAIAISTSHYTGINAIGVDISNKCIEVANKNALSNNVSDKVSFIQSDLFDNIKDKKFDMIVSNPPYISFEEMKSLMSDVKEYEPRLALTDEGDGLTFYKNIIEVAKSYLNDDGYLLLEIGYNQKNDVKKLLLDNSFNSIKVLKDLNQHNRVLCAKK